MLELLMLLPALAAPQDAPLDDIYALLRNEERTTPEVRVVQAVIPSVVYIETEVVQRTTNIFGRLSQRRYGGSGSGVVIHPDGFIVTNYHVVKDAQSITVSFADLPEEYTAELVSFVRTEDLALLRIRGEDAFPTVRLGTSLGPPGGRARRPRSAVPTARRTPSRPASSRGCTATCRFPTSNSRSTTSFRRTPRSTSATPADRCSTSGAS